jgi:hypothetical protein
VVPLRDVSKLYSHVQPKWSNSLSAIRTSRAKRKRRDKIPAGKVERGERKQTLDEVSKADKAMSKPGGYPSSGISLGGVLRRPKRHPARREAQPGSWSEGNGP